MEEDRIVVDVVVLVLSEIGVGEGRRVLRRNIADSC